MNPGLFKKAKLPRLLWRTVRDSWQILRRQLRRLVTNPRGIFAYARYRAALRRRDWPALHEMLRPLSQDAARANDTRLLAELGYAALRLEEHQLGIDLLRTAREAGGPDRWRGDDIHNDTLVVRQMEKASQGAGAGLEVSGYIRAAAARAGQTVLVADPRMVPVFQRTLPDVRVVPFGTELAPLARGRLVSIGTDELKSALGYDAETVRRLHVPLIADRTATQTLRATYLSGRSLPLIGLSWWSSHYGKDLPSPQHWARLVAAIPAQYVSLQYGDVGRDIAILNGGAPERVVVDVSVDQMTDMDRFASQIAALDLVVSISNSGAHLAGALGQRMILVRDDLFRRNWSYRSRRVPWYPSVVVVGKDGRSWDEAFEDVIATAKAMLADKT